MQKEQAETSIRRALPHLFGGRTFLTLAMVNVFTVMVLLSISTHLEVLELLIGASITSIVCVWVALGDIPFTRRLGRRFWLTGAMMNVNAFVVLLSISAPVNITLAVGALAATCLWAGLHGMPSLQSADLDSSQSVEVNASRPKLWLEMILVGSASVMVVAFIAIEVFNMGNA